MKAIPLSGDAPADLEITYDDTHPLWGGTRIVVSGDGRGRERRARAGGDPRPEIVESTVAPDQLLDLISLLIELKAWEQQTAEGSDAVPDEGRATLIISVGREASRVWERTYEMGRNRRLARVEAGMSEIVRSGPAG